MSIRRLLSATPLAILVAMVVHVAGFGFEHAPGAGHALELAETAGSGLTLALLATFFGAALGEGLPSFATRDRRGYGLCGLAATGFAAFALIELCEGHFSLGGALRALLAVVPAAAFVAAVARLAGGAARRAGRALAAFTIAERAASPRAFRSSATARVAAHAGAFGRVRPGRAPPLFA